MKSFRVYRADQYTVAVQGNGLHKTLFQIHCRDKDGSIFVAFPYARLGVGRVGIVHIPVGNPESVIFGVDAPMTVHAVKYMHHASGQAHFSQTGKVFTHVKRQAVKLDAANGHLFTVQLQGLGGFDDAVKNLPVKKGKCLVSLPLPSPTTEGLKFVVHLYSAVDFAKQQYVTGTPPHVIVDLGRGRRFPGAVLATKLQRNGLPHLLLLTIEHVVRFRPDQVSALSLLGGFDPPEQALDHSKPMSYLMMMYPDTTDREMLMRSVGSIDLPQREQ